MNLDLINLSAYEMPQAIEDKQKDYVAYGEDNNYYAFLIQQYLQSATNNAAIRSISDLIYGKGLAIEGSEIDSKEVKELRSVIGHRCLKKIILERKMLGQSAMQVIYNKAGNNRKVVKVKHFPIHTLRPEKMDAEGVINCYYYHPDWLNKRPSDKLTKIPTFGNSKEAVLLNEAKNSFSGTKVINFNNGVPSAEERNQITRDVKNKLTGSRGQKVIVAFNESADNQATVEDISLNDAPSHYEYLANEAMHKILVGHRVTSPMLLGIKDGGNGLASNSDEIMVASQLFNSTVIRTFQDEILDSIEEILELNGEVPELIFVTSQPIEFTDEDQEVEDSEDKDSKKAVKDAKKDEDDGNDKETNLSSHNPLKEAVKYAMELHINNRDNV